MSETLGGLLFRHSFEVENKTECIENITFVVKTKTKTFIFELSTHIENDSDSVILLLGSAQIPSTAHWEITPIVQCWNSYRALHINDGEVLISDPTMKSRKLLFGLFSIILPQYIFSI